MNFIPPHDGCDARIENWQWEGACAEQNVHCSFVRVQAEWKWEWLKSTLLKFSNKTTKHAVSDLLDFIALKFFSKGPPSRFFWSDLVRALFSKGHPSNFFDLIFQGPLLMMELHAPAVSKNAFPFALKKRGPMKDVIFTTWLFWFVLLFCWFSLFMNF